MTKETKDMISSPDFDIANYIPTGHSNAISRDYLAKMFNVSERIIRQLMEKSPHPIVNMGYGYFIPDMTDEIDVSELHAYIQQEQRRIQSIQRKLEDKYLTLLTPENETYEQMELQFDEEDRE